MFPVGLLWRRVGISRLCFSVKPEAETRKHPPVTDTAALYWCGTDPVRLAADRATLTLMCQAITQAFAALRADGMAGLPRNLAVLHSPALRALAVRCWARTMRPPTGELCIAAHSRHAEAEMRALAHDVTARITHSPALAELLNDRSAPSRDRS
jgi:hypothetical protein